MTTGCLAAVFQMHSYEERKKKLTVIFTENHKLKSIHKTVFIDLSAKEGKHSSPQRFMSPNYTTI